MVRKEITFEPGGGPINDLIDQAYRAKYRRRPAHPRPTDRGPAHPKDVKRVGGHAKLGMVVSAKR